jgi:AmmeMemoRadiSam system protein B
MVRPAAVAGTWYPGKAGALERDVDGYLSAAGSVPSGRVQAVIAPHAGLMFSGSVGAHAYKAAAGGDYDVAVLAGPSHFVAFEGVALWPDGAFATPLGEVRVEEATAGAMRSSPGVHVLPSAHLREHSLEMQLPFVRRLFPDLPIVPLLMGFQRRETIEQLADAIVTAVRGRRALLIASTDLSHYFDAATAASLDGRVQDAVAAFDPERLLHLFEQYPEGERGRYVACGGGPAISVMMAARRLGAPDARVLEYAHSGQVSGDNERVVGYLAAGFGTFDDDAH